MTMCMKRRSIGLRVLYCVVVIICLVNVLQPWAVVQELSSDYYATWWNIAVESQPDDAALLVGKVNAYKKDEPTPSSILNLSDAMVNISSPFIPEVTQFTPHILELISSINKSSVASCPNYYELQIDRPMTVPTVLGYYSKGNKRIENEWTRLMTRIFSRSGRVLPFNVTFGTTWGDYNNPQIPSCIGSSSPGGNMTMTNFLDIKAQVKASPSDESVWGDYAEPWDSRHKTPIFRGTGYGTNKDCSTYNAVLSDPDSIRLKAVDYSVDNPHLLDARLATRSFRAPCWKYNATNGLHKLMLVDDIPSKEYYTKYQVALVLGGIGAAFRLSTQLSTGTAVVLQQFKYEEWFTHLLQPFVHYIPVAEDLSNLNETMHWVHDHPVQVQAIGSRGQTFYDEFLSFSRNEQHLYEFLFRISLMQQ